MPYLYKFVSFSFLVFLLFLILVFLICHLIPFLGHLMVHTHTVKHSILQCTTTIANCHLNLLGRRYTRNVHFSEESRFLCCGADAQQLCRMQFLAIKDGPSVRLARCYLELNGKLHIDFVALEITFSHEGKEEGISLDGGKRLLLRPTFVVVCIAVLASNQFFLFVLLCWHPTSFLFVLLPWHPTSFFVCIAVLASNHLTAASSTVKKEQPSPSVSESRVSNFLCLLL